MKIKSGVSTIALAVFCGALTATAQTNNSNNDAGVSDRDQRQTGQMNNQTSTSNQVVVGQSLSNTNNGVDDRDQRQTGQLNSQTQNNPSQVQVAQPVENTNNGVDDRDQRTTGQMAAHDPQNGWQHSTGAMDTNQYRFGKLEKANNILGAEVKDAQGEKLGHVKDLAVDLKNGRLIEVIIARGGMLGMDEQLVAVPPSQFTCDAADKTLQLNVDKSRFTSAPAFKMAAWESSVNEAGVTQTYQYYGSQPYFMSGSQYNHGSSNDMNRFGEVRRASKVIGDTVRNMQDEKVGRVENLIVDLPAGRVVEVIIASGGFMRMGGELSAVPPQSFSYGIHAGSLTLDRNRQDLSSAPHFKSSDWSDVTNRQQVETVYHSYNVTPYFNENRTDNTAQNVQDRDGNSMTPFKQGESQSDVDTTRQIRQQVIAAKDLSVYAHNVKIITLNGKVTLRGPVNSEEEKREVGDIAAKVATGANVDNRLQVRNSNTTSSNN